MSSCLIERHRRSMNTLSIQRLAPIHGDSHAGGLPSYLVTWLPWSVLKMAGRPKPRERLL